MNECDSCCKAIPFAETWTVSPPENDPLYFCTLKCMSWWLDMEAASE